MLLVSCFFILNKHPVTYAVHVYVKYDKTPKRLEGIIFTNFRPGTPARRQVTLENCVYSGQGGGMIYI